MRLIIETPLRAFAAAGVMDDLSEPAQLRYTGGVSPIEDFVPARVYSPRGSYGPVSFAYGGKEAQAPVADGQITVAEFKDDAAVETFLSENPNVLVYADPPIAAFPAYCGPAPIGNASAVAATLGVQQLAAQGATGSGVHIAIVDTGINGNHAALDGSALGAHLDTSLQFPGGYAPGSQSDMHGTMCAFDALITAPEATLLDLALLAMKASSFEAFISNAISSYTALIEWLRAKQVPLVVSNSWGLYDTSVDAPPGTVANYSANPNHPFNRQVASLAAAGADVVFAAGNCGQECPVAACGNSTGPGRSIHGANSSPAVTCVAAVTLNGDRLGYSSQGPGGLDPQKPDIATYSHFVGSGVGAVDSGTSAACPIAAGVIAAIRSRSLSTPPGVIRAALQHTALQSGSAPWDADLGYGLIQPVAALNAIP